MSRGGNKTVTALDKHIGGRLRAARVVAALSQEQVGTHIGVSLQQIQKYERGDNRVSSGALVVLAKFFNRPVTWFFEGAVALGSTEPPRDVASLLLASPHGLRLAEAFLAITHTSDRATLASVAEAIARAPAAQLKAVG